MVVVVSYKCPVPSPWGCAFVVFWLLLSLSWLGCRSHFVCFIVIEFCRYCFLSCQYRYSRSYLGCACMLGCQGISAIFWISYNLWRFCFTTLGDHTVSSVEFDWFVLLVVPHGSVFFFPVSLFGFGFHPVVLVCAVSLVFGFWSCSWYSIRRVVLICSWKLLWLPWHLLLHCWLL